MNHDENRLWAQGVLKKCMDKYRWVVENNRGKIPNTTDIQGKYNDLSGHYAWTNGFWMGILWQMYIYTGEEGYSILAKETEEKMDRYFNDYMDLDHDVGFVWIPSSVFNYEITGDAAALKRALHAANLLAGRYNPKGGFIRAWNILPHPAIDKTGWAIIDCLMNLPLLYWAGARINDPRYSQIADKHAHTVIEYFIREDGSVKHIAEFDPETGAYIKSHGGQGMRHGSTWSRGQGWGLYGLSVLYRLTGNSKFLDAAKRTADYVLRKIPKDRIVPIDFNQPADVGLEDSSAAAIIACGLLELAESCKCDEYKVMAAELLRKLDTERANYGRQLEAIVQNCSDAYNEPDTHHKTLVYADYYYIEALRKLAHAKGSFIW